MKVRFKVRWTQGPEEKLGSGYFFDHELDDSTRVVVGRSKKAGLRLPHPTVSDEHFSVSQKNGRLFVEDLESLNGTVLNGRSLSLRQRAVLTKGDILGVGPFVISLSDSESVQEATLGTESLALELARQMIEEDPEQRPFVTIVEGQNIGSRLSLPIGQSVVLGRDPGNHLSLLDSDVSRKHARIYCALDGCWLEDMESKNGVFVEESSITGSWKLEDGQRIRLGQTVLVYSDPAESYLGSLEEMADHILDDEERVFETGLFDEDSHENHHEEGKGESSSPQKANGGEDEGASPPSQKPILNDEGLDEEGVEASVQLHKRQATHRDSLPASIEGSQKGHTIPSMGMEWFVLICLGGVLAVGAAVLLFILLKIV